MNARLWPPELEVEGDFPVVIDGKWVNLGGVILTGVTPEGRRRWISSWPGRTGLLASGQGVEEVQLLVGC
ncbi:hypothetical protein [Metallosphaera javensis (ex Sakai et al. 2022)]|uniref:hypothetical protein n=1 Tax=Metallosphaera javensis (ex Sakai et al. 2022) TaxID=2775498 RepID=UPI0025898B1D|nr:MAG: hypothetical protein MjAS7_0109 [Metallosphaera javensis (ex Sakai et al. 2022)]